MSQFELQLDGNAVADAVRTHVEKTLGMDLSGKSVEVTFSQGRKTPQNPNPKSTATVIITTSTDEVNTTQTQENGSASKSPVVGEATVETAEVAETAKEEPAEEVVEAVSDKEVDENGVVIEEDDLPMSGTETEIADEDDLFN